ncbi:MAG: sulfatase-like hydrolase/transferase [Bacteroidia bacterium]|nr:sulfatase-like hydrolase/transferase [Bacteroidia bacterium]
MNQLPAYTRLVRFFFVLLVSLRAYECLMLSRFHPGLSLIRPELAGLLQDAVFLTPLLVAGLLLYFLLHKRFKKGSVVIVLTLFSLYLIAAVLILQYFIYQLQPLDKFLFEHTRQEVLFTVKTTEVNYIQVIGFMVLAPLTAAGVFMLKGRVVKWLNRAMLFVWLSGIFCLALYAPNESDTRYVLNKPVYFFQSAYRFLAKKETNAEGDYRAIVKQYREAFTGMNYIGNEFPFLHETTKQDVLGSWFNAGDKLPNIVVLMVEGLADDFLHPYHGLQLMPFLDSLKNNSLYWDRFLTLGERSYAVTPSLTGSLPYGRSGFTMLESMPYHFSLVNVLKQNGYYTSFYYGQGAWFHNKNVYYEQNFIDRITDKEKFEGKYPRILVKEKDNFFWGYDDRSLMRKAMELTKVQQSRPLLDIFFTGSMHNPFTIQEEEAYQKRVTQQVLKKTGEQSEFELKYGKYLRAVMFTDDALREYISAYSKLPDFKNTVFIITGDHPMTDIPARNSLKRYHVPLIVYSPLLKAPHVFHSVGSHLDLYEPLLVWLQKMYQIQIPAVQTAVSNSLDTTTAFINRKPVVFMNGNRDIVEMYSGNYFVSENALYRVDEKFNLVTAENENLKKKMQQQIEAFRRANMWATVEQHLLPDSIYFNSLGYQVYRSAVMRPVVFSGGFSEVIPQTRVPAKELVLDLFGIFNQPAKVPLHGVYQLTNSKDSLLLWVSFGIEAEKKTFRYHQKIKPVSGGDSLVFFKCYLTNEKQADYKLQVKAAVYHTNH